jgi:hypothetical protein
MKIRKSVMMVMMTTIQILMGIAKMMVTIQMVMRGVNLVMIKIQMVMRIVIVVMKMTIMKTMKMMGALPIGDSHRRVRVMKLK